MTILDPVLMLVGAWDFIIHYEI